MSTYYSSHIPQCHGSAYLQYTVYNLASLSHTHTPSMSTHRESTTADMVSVLYLESQAPISQLWFPTLPNPTYSPWIYLCRWTVYSRVTTSFKADLLFLSDLGAIWGHRMKYIQLPFYSRANYNHYGELSARWTKIRSPSSKRGPVERVNSAHAPSLGGAPCTSKGAST